MNRSDVIAEVAYQVADPGKPARECGVRVYRPEREGAEWVCLVELQDLETYPIEVRGADSFDALTAALEFVRQHLDTCRTSEGAFRLPTSGDRFPQERPVRRATEEERGQAG